jgi:hypothetical protein
LVLPTTFLDRVVLQTTFLDRVVLQTVYLDIAVPSQTAYQQEASKSFYWHQALDSSRLLMPQLAKTTEHPTVPPVIFPLQRTGRSSRNA